MKILRRKWASVALIFIMLAAVHAHAEDGKISGYLFGDYYWFAKNHDTAQENQNGFWIRRGYFTYDKDLDEQFTSRFQLEVNQDDFTSTTSTKMTPFVKTAYLKRKGKLHDFTVGLSDTPTLTLVEHHWGYRSVEKTPLDLQKIGASRDLGLAYEGHLDANKHFGYHLMIGNSSGTGHETNKNKKIYLALNAAPADDFIVQLYGDYENNKKNAPNTSTSVLQAFAGIKTGWGRAGLLFAQSTEEQGENAADQKIRLASAYGVLKITDKTAAFARVDHLFDANPQGDKIAYIPMVKDAESTLFILGADYKAANNVSIQPNVEVVTYSGTKYDEDIIPRITLFYQF